MALTETERALLVAGIAASVTITEALLAALVLQPDFVIT